jgi:hypothetical protein
MKGLGSQYNLQRHALNDLLPPTKPHLLRVPLLPTKPQARDQAFNTWVMGDISEPNQNDAKNKC